MLSKANRSAATTWCYSNFGWRTVFPIRSATPLLFEAANGWHFNRSCKQLFLWYVNCQVSVSACINICHVYFCPVETINTIPIPLMDASGGRDLKYPFQFRSPGSPGCHPSTVTWLTDESQGAPNYISWHYYWMVYLAYLGAYLGCHILGWLL